MTAAAERLGHDVDGFDIAGGGHEVLDITDERATRAALAEARPAGRHQLRGVHDVDGAESDEERALVLNGTAAGNVAARRGRGRRRGRAPLDRLRLRRHEDRALRRVRPDRPAVGAYGRTKLAGEHALAEANPNHAIVRTAWLFGAGGPNFVDTMLRARRRARRGQRRHRPGRLPDVDGPPRRRAAGASPSAADTGLFHCAGGGHVLLVRASRWRSSTGPASTCRVRPTTSEAFPRPARRPAYSVMVSERPEAPRPAPVAGRAGRLSRTNG